MFEKLQTGEKKSMMHQDRLEPAAIRFTLEHLQESARQSGYFLPHVFISTGALLTATVLWLHIDTHTCLPMKGFMNIDLYC